MNTQVLRKLSYDELRARLDNLHAEHGMPDELRQLIHELEIHQVELEMQNRELREAQATLEESRDRYVELYDAAPVGFLTLRGNGSIRELNLTAAAMIGVERDKLIGASLVSWLTPFDRPRLLAFLRNPRKEGGSVQLRLHGAGKEQRTVRLQVLWAEDPISAAHICRAAMIDVTEEEESRAKLRDHDRRKNEFLMALGHELRNPLAPVRNAAEVLLRQQDSPSEVRWAAEVIGRQSEHMTRLIDDLLDVARITQGSVQVKKAEVDLRQAAEMAVEQVRPRLAENHQELKTILPPTPVKVDGDAVRLSQIIVNLLTNASKFSPTNARIELALATARGEAQLWVRDPGVGISRNALDQIFEPFVQADQQPDRAPEGLGLGLALAQGLAQAHGGSLEASSAGPGLGSIFTLRIPLAPAPAPAPAPAKTKLANGLRILIVDDNRDVAESTGMLLGLAGHETRAVADGNAALAVAQEYQPDVILLDIGLPGMDGFEVARHLRDTPAGTRATILAVSGYDLSAGPRGDTTLFDGRLLKPVGLKALLDAIGNCQRPPE
jgi:PAS domain S-box-containing protein